MDKIVTNSTSTTQWKDLVTEASQACQISLHEDVESYLVFLLMRFSCSPQMANKVMALEFLETLNSYGTNKSLALRDVGDQCLLYSGLFPGRARRRRVRVSYYVNIGKSAYLSLAEYGRKSENNLFGTLANEFVSLMDILQSMREVNNKAMYLDPIQAEELWSDTGSVHALETLKGFASAKSPILNLVLSELKH
jgi:hypothetical protein